MTKIAMLSGGRDSTAMIFTLLDKGIDLDYIIFTDTGAEFSLMYEYLNRVDARLMKNYGKKITRLSHVRDHNFETWCFGRITKGKRAGMIRGIPMVTQPCYWKRESKVRPFEHFLKNNAIDDYTQYIGYTYSEKNRAKVADEKQEFPLVDMRMCEADVDRTLERLDLINPLYANFERTGCYFCPYQKVRSFYLLWKLYPDEWRYMRQVEIRLNNLMYAGDKVLNPQWNIRHSIQELENAFRSGDMLYDVESPQACECAI